jgi:hypothetical protein
MWHVWVRGVVHTGYWWGNLGERYHLECTGVYGRIILKRIFRKYDWAVDWIHLAQDRDKRRAPIYTVKKSKGCVKCEQFLDELRNCFSRRTLLPWVG